ncbi:MAG: hypothetical protein HYT34_00470 [Candidatus Ryanbacteria bacterium]|nr:hypothetical protein [Candidatus Ryanbacteria bacterium]
MPKSKWSYVLVILSGFSGGVAYGVGADHPPMGAMLVSLAIIWGLLGLIEAIEHIAKPTPSK